jgi:hypothetical protein
MLVPAKYGWQAYALHVGHSIGILILVNAIIGAVLTTALETNRGALTTDHKTQSTATRIRCMAPFTMAARRVA